MPKGPSSVSLPLVRSSASVRDALALTQQLGAGAVAASNGSDFLVYSATILHDAAVSGDDQQPLVQLAGLKVSSLSLPEAAILDIRAPSDYAYQVQNALQRFGTTALVTSVNLAHDGGVLIVFDDPTGSVERIVRPVYVCPSDSSETNPGPKYCSIHKVDYEPKV